MVRRATAREKFGREDKSAQMYSAFGWRVVLLARMSCARACPSKLVGRSGPFVTAGCGHAVVTVLSSLLPLLQTSVGKFKPSWWCGKVGARSASKPKAPFPRHHAAAGLYSLPLD